MALENLDLENKLIIPTQELMAQIQLDLATLYASLRQMAIDAHELVAVLGKQWYDQPMETTVAWYQAGQGYANGVYQTAVNDWVPQIENSYEQALETVVDYSLQARGGFEYLLDNPDKVSAEAIESITEAMVATGNLSMEMVVKLQETSAEIIALLMEQPLQTLQTAYVDVLNGLLNTYFDLVSAALTVV